MHVPPPFLFPRPRRPCVAGEAGLSRTGTLPCVPCLPWSPSLRPGSASGRRAPPAPPTVLTSRGPPVADPRSSESLRGWPSSPLRFLAYFAAHLPCPGEPGGGSRSAGSQARQMCSRFRITFGQTCTSCEIRAQRPHGLRRRLDCGHRRLLEKEAWHLVPRRSGWAHRSLTTEPPSPRLPTECISGKMPRGRASGDHPVR